jgi:hypothetical protein
LITIDESASLLEHLLKIKDIREQLPIGRKMEEEDMVVIYTIWQVLKGSVFSLAGPTSLSGWLEPL